MKEYERPVVSISCAAYNHENYIADALEGFLAQKTNFPIEILIHDDASTDRTADIIRAYHAKYPDLIKPIFQVENQYSKGAKINVDFNFTRAKGRYIAICEGDDYWTDPLKLSRQVEAMEARRECDISFHPMLAEHEGTKKQQILCHFSRQEKIYTIEDVILGGGGFMPTASIMLRNRVIPRVIRFFEKAKGAPVGDGFIQVLGAEKGGAIYLPFVAGVYRKNAPGSWSLSIKSDQAKADKWTIALLDSIEMLNEFTEGRHADALSKRIRRIVFSTLKREYISISTKEKIYKDFFKFLAIHERFAWNMVLRHPLYKHLKRLAQKTNL